MDFTKEIKALKRKHFQLGALIISSVLGLVGFGFLLYSGIFYIKSFTDFINVLGDYGHYVIFGGFFFLLFIYLAWFFFVNLCFRPKKEVLYLHKKDNNLFFVNRRGKKVFCDKITVKKEGYYNVWKTKHYVLRILNKSNVSWPFKYKKSFWLTWYSPIGCIEDLLLLPNLYIIFIFFVIRIIFGNKLTRFDSFIQSIPVALAILIDLVCKLKYKK